MVRDVCGDRHTRLQDMACDQGHHTRREDMGVTMVADNHETQTLPSFGGGDEGNGLQPTCFGPHIKARRTTEHNNYAATKNMKRYMAKPGRKVIPEEKKRKGKHHPETAQTVRDLCGDRHTRVQDMGCDQGHHT